MANHDERMEGAQAIWENMKQELMVNTGIDEKNVVYLVDDKDGHGVICDMMIDAMGFTITSKCYGNSNQWEYYKAVDARDYDSIMTCMSRINKLMRWIRDHPGGPLADDDFWARHQAFYTERRHLKR